LADRYVLAVSISHNASAALMRNGRVVAAAQEERFARVKNYVGYPKRAIDWCLIRAGIEGRDLERIAYTSTHSSGLFTKAKVTTNFSISDYKHYYGDHYYQPRLRGEDVTGYLRWLRDDPKFRCEHEYFDFGYLDDAVLADPQKEVDLFRAEQVRVLAGHLGVPPSRVEFIDHHKCHAFYAYFASPFRGRDCAVLTFDGWGDGRNLTVWSARDDRLALLADSGENDIGRVYKFATLILGMRPDEHEYKVMGLAPYASKLNVQSALAPLTELSDVAGLRIVSKNRPPDLYGYLEQAWKDERFDGIAGATQAWVEDLVQRWVASIARETGLGRFVISGGISMNVKMNKAIAELREVESLFVCGSGGDESLSIGGCYVLNDEMRDSAPLDHLYLGYDVHADLQAFDAAALAARFDVDQNCEIERVASLLARGDILAVIRGQAEFGARALGNRSILAHPGRKDAVRRINAAIKNRDFWMPFAVSILEEHQHEFLINPKELSSPFMTMAFDTAPQRYPEIEAGTHPYDRTARPQFVSRITAPQYHRLISEFHRLTGIPALLNTSFNLHGEPIVNDLSDAIRTFERSALDHLFVGDTVLISKREGSTC
jgi:carbamoyltransferase